MKLVASLMVRNEIGRYLEQSVGALLEFCDEVRVLDDWSDDGSFEWLRSLPSVSVNRTYKSGMFTNEGRARQQLLEWTLDADPTHILAIDADEFVADPALVVEACRTRGQIFSLVMQEVWELDGDCLCIREDGGWRSHPVVILYEATTHARSWAMRDRELACGRVPYQIEAASSSARSTGTEILHFGWANPHERASRHQRYIEHDGGRFHNRAHLDSIMWAESRVKLSGRQWPKALELRRPVIQEYARFSDA